MATEFLDLPSEEQKDVINAAAPKIGLLPAVVEKDVWVCVVLNFLFSIPERREMVFKGGTSLSKVYGLIKRFSEDIDISVNFLKDYGTEISKTKAGNIRDEIESNLQTYKESILIPALTESAKKHNLTVTPGDTPWEIDINYKSVLATTAGYIKPRVKIELSGRNQIEPNTTQKIRPYLAQETTGLVFPEPTIDALLAERTFWEKVTLIHAELHKGSFEESADRMSRHWSDVSVLMKQDAGKNAIKNTELCEMVVKHKDAFWRDGKAKYGDCLNKTFRLVPTGNVLAVLKSDYEAMITAGMFFDEKPASFDDMMNDIAALESTLNS
ncbi:MAG: nucleotidyl transferase AbiEii/AbiGii toxin family protein [Candidatus Obscuribacterales bacterium]